MAKTLTADSRPRNDREMDILQVAGIINANWDPGYHNPDVEAFAREINDGDGWTYDCRYPSHQYINDTDWTRIEGMSLSDGDLGAAVALAKHMMDWDWFTPIELPD